MKLALALALLPGVSAQQQHMLGAQGPTVALDRFAGFDTGAGPLSDAVLPAAASTLDRKFSPDGIVAGEPSKLDREVSKYDRKLAAVAGEHSKLDDIVEGEASEDARRRAAEKKTSAASSCSGLSKLECKKTDGCDYKKKQCSAASSCSGLSKRECKTTDGCKYKKKKDKCLAK